MTQPQDEGWARPTVGKQRQQGRHKHRNNNADRTEGCNAENGRIDEGGAHLALRFHSALEKGRKVGKRWREVAAGLAGPQQN